MTTSITTPQQLIDKGFIGATEHAAITDVTERYALSIPPHMVAEILKNPIGELAKQFVPNLQELTTLGEEMADPIGDEKFSPVKGVVHRYQDRVLLKLTHLCPVYCRFCFRREQVGKDNAAPLNETELETALSYIANNQNIWEVILTGGDPFILSPRRVKDVVQALDKIAHVKILRWHTRVPIVAPEKITNEFVEALKSTKASYVAIHSNHVDEFTAEAVQAIARLKDAGFNLISQTVLLRGVNDNVETLETLMRRFVELGIKPYYLHHPDLAKGTSHFRLTIEEGREIVRDLRNRVSGLCMPTYVLDIPGGEKKIPLE